MKGRTGGSLWAEDYAFLITTRVPLLLPVRPRGLTGLKKCITLEDEKARPLPGD